MSESEQANYVVVRGVIKLPRNTEHVFVGAQDFIVQGQSIPKGLFSRQELRSWEEDGRIALFESLQAGNIEGIKPITARGKWEADPATLAGKSLEDLLIMVNEIDEDYDLSSLEDEAAAIRLLTSDWNPDLRQTVPAASDRSAPHALRAHNLEQTKDGGGATSNQTIEQSAEAASALALARSKAQAPEME